MNTNVLRILAVTAWLLIAGCAAVGPDFEKPEIEVASEWLEAEDADVISNRVEYQDWWQVFNDPVLNELIATAYDENLNLQVAGLRILEARAKLGYSTSLRYPQSQTVQANATKSRSSENAPPFSNLPPIVGDNIDPTVNFWQTSFSVAWEADVWGKFRRGVEAADANLAASMLDYDSVLVTLTGDVALLYTQIRTLEQRLTYTQGNVQVQKRALDLAETRFEFGATSELDVAQAKSQLNGTEAIIPLLELNIRQSRNALSLLLGMGPGEVDRILGGPGTLPGAPKQAAVGIPAELIRRGRTFARPRWRRPRSRRLSGSRCRICTRASVSPARSASPASHFQTSLSQAVASRLSRRSSTGKYSTTAACGITFVFRTHASNNWLSATKMSS